MYLHSHGPGALHANNKPVRSIEDFKGMRLREHGTIALIIKALDGTPVSFPIPELYQSFKKILSVVHFIQLKSTKAGVWVR
jgi:TRAP-type transport system periplasmic protein